MTRLFLILILLAGPGLSYTQRIDSEAEIENSPAA